MIRTANLTSSRFTLRLRAQDRWSDKKQVSQSLQEKMNISLMDPLNKQMSMLIQKLLLLTKSTVREQVIAVETKSTG